MDNELVALLRAVPLFSPLSEEQAAKLLAFVRFERRGRGEAIVLQGEAGDSFYVVYSGRVEVSVAKRLFGSKTVAELGPGDFFGELSLMLDQPRAATVKCLEDCELLVFKRLEFEMMLSRHPDVEKAVRDAARRRFSGR
ncbi:MAG: cyclic nucleotide-binding domain-containing protein [Elusimicrobia bacterium]|nr:cyclic nucleotide-binding domain-containing protein [Elusimicrobiota bacterium]